jgi:hypothetical protein
MWKKCVYLLTYKHIYIHTYIHTLFTLPKIWELLISFCPWHLEHPSSASNNNQEAFLHSSVLVPLFQDTNILVKTLPVFVTEAPKLSGKNPCGSPINVSWGTYYTQYLGKNITLHPQFHGSSGFYEFLKKCSQHF